MTNAERALYTYQRRSGITLGMENRAARVCELCGEQYPPHILRCLQDGELTVAATTAHIQANKSPAMLLGSFFAPDDLDSRATSAALAPIQALDDDDLVEELSPEAEEEESNSTRRALKAVDFAGQRKSLLPVYEHSEQKPTSFALKPIRDTIPPVLDNAETALVPKSKKTPSLVLAPEQLTTRSSAVTDPGIATTRSSAATDPGIALEAATRVKPTTPKSTAALPEPSVKKSGKETLPDIDLFPAPKAKPSSGKATVADVEAPKLSKKTIPPLVEPLVSKQLSPIDPRAIDDWKIAKPLPSKVLKSVPLAQTAKRPTLTKRHAGGALLLALVCGAFFTLWSIMGLAVDKKEQLASLAPVQERVEISLRSTPSGARVSGTINGEPFSPRFSPSSLIAPKDAEVTLTFEYANYAPSKDQFVADSSRDLSVHLSLLPTDPSTRPQQVATKDPKETTVSTPVKAVKSSRPNTKTTKTNNTKVNNTKITTKTNTGKTPPNNGKRPPLPATPEL